MGIYFQITQTVPLSAEMSKQLDKVQLYLIAVAARALDNIGDLSHTENTKGAKFLRITAPFQSKTRINANKNRVLPYVWLNSIIKFQIIT